SSISRHTRFSRDWSSDVCSSDLVHELKHVPWIGRRQGFDPFLHGGHFFAYPGFQLGFLLIRPEPPALQEQPHALNGIPLLLPLRSEERRVGSERRCWISRLTLNI